MSGRARTDPAALYPLRGGGYLWARSGCCARLARVPAVAGSPSGDDAAPSMNRFLGERGLAARVAAMSMNGRRPGVAVGWPPVASRAVGKKPAGTGWALRRRQVPEEEICSGTGGRTAVRSAAAAPARCTTACARSWCPLATTTGSRTTRASGSSRSDGKALRVRQTLIFEDSHGRELLKIQERVARVRDTMEIEDPGGRTVATVKKALITPLRDRWTVKVADGPDLDVKGNIVDHEYTVEDGRSTVAEVSKKWFRIADTYGVEVAPGQDPALMLAVTAVLDQMAHEAR